MVVSRGRTPSAGEVLTQLFQAKGLRDRVLTTLGILLLVRLGIYIPIPGIDREAFQQFIDQGGQLTAALPSLEELQKNEGEAGRRKLAQITRYVALGWGLLQSTVFALILRPYSLETIPDGIFVVQTALALVTGSMVVMWLSEVITERGIGQGASLVIFLNIVATLPRALGSTVELAQSGDRGTIAGIIVLVLVFLVTIVGIVCVQEGSRRIPIVSAEKKKRK